MYSDKLNNSGVFQSLLRKSICLYNFPVGGLIKFLVHAHFDFMGAINQRWKDGFVAGARCMRGYYELEWSKPVRTRCVGRWLPVAKFTT